MKAQDMQMITDAQTPKKEKKTDVLYIKISPAEKAKIERKSSSWDADFYERFRADIMRHKAAKKYFDERGLKKLPGINQLREQWGELEKQRRPLCAEYKAENQKFKDLCTAKSNTARMPCLLRLNRGLVATPATACSALTPKLQ